MTYDLTIATSWINVAPDNDFPIQNIPLGIIKKHDGTVSAATAIGDNGLDLAALHHQGFFRDISLPGKIFENTYLNDFIALGKPVWRQVRNRLMDLLRHDNPELRDNKKALEGCLFNLNDIELQMPVKIGDYTDFYSSKEHATNVGAMFRDPKNALLPNWLHLPVAYHGRASSIIVSGQNFHRPKGQVSPQLPLGGEGGTPSFSPTKALDFELEMAFIIGKQTELGHPVSTSDADEHIFGMVLFNDWSARDIQRWEYVPLGPFLGKNFASTMSPWIISLDALEPFYTKSPIQEPEVLPYLKNTKEDNAIDINLEVWLEAANSHQPIAISHKLCTTNYKHLYWSMEQQLAHHTVNGCNINVGDLMASGTISGPTPDTFGSMLELTWNGSKPVTLPNGEQRKFLQDGDSITIKGYAQKGNLRIGFGEARAKILSTL